MRIRPATLSDEFNLRALWDESNREVTSAPYEQSSFAPELLTDHISLVAEEADELVGSVYAAMPGPEHGFVFGLYVVLSSRRQGVGRALMVAVADELRIRGRRFVVLSVDTSNAFARAMYEELGFVDQARILRADLEDLLRRHS
jgi:ribosomal protein S18 acetylase RimI-like enzyme